METIECRECQEEVVLSGEPFKLDGALCIYVFCDCGAKYLHYVKDDNDMVLMED